MTDYVDAATIDAGDIPAASPTYVQYPFPLANGGFAYVHVTGRLTATDVERMAAYLRALVIDVTDADVAAGSEPPEEDT